MNEGYQLKEKNKCYCYSMTDRHIVYDLMVIGEGRRDDFASLSPNFKLNGVLC